MSLDLFMEDDTIGMVSYMVGLIHSIKMETEEKVSERDGPKTYH